MQKNLRVFLAVFVVASVCFALASPIQSVLSVDSNISDAYSWPMYQNDPKHSGYSLSAGPLGNQTLWKYTTNDTFWNAPTITNGILYAGSDQHGSMYALNVTTGTLLWRHTTGTITSSPAVIDGILYVGYVGGFCALNASNGGFIWNFATPYFGGYSSPVVINGVVYTGEDTNLYALNASTGSKIWSFPTNGTIIYAPAFDNNLIIATYRTNNWAINGSVYALDASTGSLVWKFSAKNQFYSSPCTSPTIADGMVFVGYDNGYQYALDEATGTVIWSNGTKIWIRVGNGYSANGHVTSAAIANGKVYFGATSDNNSSKCNIYAFDQFAGTKIWTYNMDCWINGQVVLAGNLVFLTGNDRYIYALNAETGSEVWKYMTGSGIMSSPSVADGKVYVGSDDGSIYAIGGADLSYGPNPTAKPPTTPGPTTTFLPTPIASPTPTSVTQPLPKSTPTTTPITFGFEITGNITSSQISDANWVTNQNTTKISFTVTGESGTFGFSNITIAKNRIPQATTPIIYVDKIVVPEQGYTQDAYNYYVWYTIHFSTHQILIDFKHDANATPQPTKQSNGAQGEITFESVIFGLAIAFAILTTVTVVLKLLMREKKKS